MCTGSQLLYSQVNSIHQLTDRFFFVSPGEMRDVEHISNPVNSATFHLFNRVGRGEDIRLLVGPKPGPRDCRVNIWIL